MKVKYYKGSVVTSNQEIPFEGTQGVTSYIKAHFEDDERLEKAELYDGGKLVRIDYYDVSSPENTITSHLQSYPDTQFAIWKTLTTVQSYVWKYVCSYSSSGELTGFSKILSDEHQQEIMQIEMDKNHRVLQITKYYWEPDHTLRYVFEYDENGALYSGFDVLYGDHASFSEIKDHLPDAAFYESGYALLHAIEGLAIPPDPSNCG